MRLGNLVTPTILLYGTGGLAYGLSNSNAFAIYDVSSAITDEIGPGGATKSAFRLGWTAGGGVEWMLANNWSVKADYLYYDLGTTSLYLGQGLGIQKIQTATSGIPVGQIAQIRNAYANTHFSGNIVRAGVNYHFNWAAAPVVAKY
jgi:outer membrane immunogenic protein